MFTGVFVASITPFKNDGIDEDALREHINWLISEGIHGIVPCGTTGEAATLTNSEYAQVVKIISEEVKGRCPIIAGAGTNSTAKAIETARLVIEAGADATLQVTPYYNKPTQEGLFQHFKKIAEEVKAPHILYNVPGRTAVNMTAETTIRLSSLGNIAGIKEASGDLKQIQKIREKTSPDFTIFSGNDNQNLEIYKIGGNGAISVTANIAPKLVSEVWNLYMSNNINKANELQEKLSELNTSMFFETNPIPVKTGAALMGKCTDEFRLPLCNMSNENLEKLKAVLQKYKLIN